MKNRHLHRLIYHVRHRYLTLNTIVMIIAFILAAGLVWGSLTAMQRNYTLQRTLDRKQQEERVATLETRTLELESAYYQTEEYQELAAREKLGLGLPGEKVLLLPRATEQTEPIGTGLASTEQVSSEKPSNFQQWMDFLFGTNRSRLQ